MTVHNRLEEGTQLLIDIQAWCQRTETPESSIGHFLFRHPGFVGLLRLRLTVTEEKEASVRQFMAEYPDGYRGDLTNHMIVVPRERPKSTKHLNGGPEEHVRLSGDEIAARQVDNGICPRCGARNAVGCEHHPVQR